MAGFFRWTDEDVSSKGNVDQYGREWLQAPSEPPPSTPISEQTTAKWLPSFRTREAKTAVEAKPKTAVSPTPQPNPIRVRILAWPRLPRPRYDDVDYQDFHQTEERGANGIPVCSPRRSETLCQHSYRVANAVHELGEQQFEDAIYTNIAQQRAIRFFSIAVPVAVILLAVFVLF